MSENKKAGTVRSASDENTSADVSFVKKHNIIPKILCIVAAFVLWIYVMQTESPEYEEVFRSVDVNITNSAELQNTSGLSVYGKSANTVNVKLMGKKSVIDKLSADDLYAYIDVSKVKEAGQHMLNVYVDLPDGISMVTPEPSALSVYVDETAFVSLNIREKLENFVLSSPYELGDIKFEFDSITVSGPKKKLDDLAEAQVVVNMAEKTSSFVTKCPISLINRNGEKVDMAYLTKSVEEVSVTVPIYITKEIPVVTNFKYGFLNSNTATVTVTPPTITVKGDESKFSDMSNIIEAIEIDEKSITESTYIMSVTPKALTDVIIADDDTEIKVVVELNSSLKTKQFTTSNIEVTGAASDIEYEVLDKSTVVTLRGKMAALSEIKTSDISVVVDLSGFDSASTGIVSRAATIIVDSEHSDDVIELGTYSIQIKIN